MNLQVCDIVFVKKKASWLDRALELVTPVEQCVSLNHSGIIVTSGDESKCFIIESNGKVTQKILTDVYGDCSSIAIFRPVNLSKEDKKIMITYAEKFIGEKEKNVVARVYRKVEKYFGIPWAIASEKDILNFCLRNDKKYKLIHVGKNIKL